MTEITEEELAELKAWRLRYLEHMAMHHPIALFIASRLLSATRTDTDHTPKEGMGPF